MHTPNPAHSRCSASVHLGHLLPLPLARCGQASGFQNSTAALHCTLFGRTFRPCPLHTRPLSSSTICVQSSHPTGAHLEWHHGGRNSWLFSSAVVLEAQRPGVDGMTICLFSRVPSSSQEPTTSWPSALRGEEPSSQAFPFKQSTSWPGLSSLVCLDPSEHGGYGRN